MPVLATQTSGVPATGCKTNQIYKNCLSRKFLTLIIELAFSVLATPTLLSNFAKKRGHLTDVNRLLRAPTFNPERSALAMGANDKPSSTGMLNGQLGAG